MDQVVAIRPPARGIPRGAQNLRDLDHAELAAFLARALPAAPRHRADQVFRWLHQRRAADVAAMSDVPAAERTTLAAEVSQARLTIDAVQSARDGTRKLRLRSDDNVLEIYIGYLRKKLEADGQPRLIQTVRGIGYVLREE